VIGESAKLYLAAILDLYSRFVVGWAVSAVNDRRLTLKALQMAVHRRCPEPGLLHHSDRGCTYTCEDYQRYLASCGITCSMSRRADCYDNAVMESFFATVKKEEADRFELVDQKDSAHLVVLFGKIVKGHAGNVTRNSGFVAPVERITLEVRDRVDDSLLWREETGPLFSPEQRLVKHLRERLQSADKVKQ
jgi:transposase InsO family protein